MNLLVDIEVPGRLRAAFTLDPGAPTAVIGPNGSGKTTLLKVLAGIIEPTGSITFDGVSWTEPTRRIQDRRVGYVFQDINLFPHLNAIENVAFGLHARGVARSAALDQALTWLERFEIGDLAQRRPSELSGGQAQRVAIARALAVGPDLLLLDEPFSGLDVGVAAALRVELAQHLGDFPGLALMVTHDAIDALTLAQQVLVLDEGAIAQRGTPVEVAARPRTDHVARLVGLNVHREGDSLLAFRPSAVTVSVERPMGSARHVWHGLISGLAPHGDAVRLAVDAGQVILADITPAAAAELALAPGREVWLAVKETAVDWYPAHPR